MQETLDTSVVWSPDPLARKPASARLVHIIDKVLSGQGNSLMQHDITLIFISAINMQ
jgi:hypothetical protein